MTTKPTLAEAAVAAMGNTAKVAEVVRSRPPQKQASNAVPRVERQTAKATLGSKRPPSRRGKVVWLTYLEPDMHRRMKAAAALERKSLQKIGEEAAEALIRRTGL